MSFNKKEYVFRVSYFVSVGIGPKQAPFRDAFNVQSQFRSHAFYGRWSYLVLVSRGRGNFENMLYIVMYLIV